MTSSSMSDFELKMPINAQHVPAGRGFEWYGEAWTLFKKAPLPLMALPIILLIGNLVCSALPIIGWIISIVFNILMTYGSIILAANLERTGEIRWSYAIEVVRMKFFNMLGFFLLKNILMVAGFLFIVALGLWTIFGSLSAISEQVPQLFGMDLDGLINFSQSHITFSFVFIAVVTMMLVAILVMCVQFMGDSLIALSDANPIEAALLSLSAIGKNSGSLTVAGFIGFFLWVPIVLTLGLGLFVYYPLVILVTYRAFQDIFRSGGHAYSGAPL